jgi:hypothetical protein
VKVSRQSLTRQSRNQKGPEGYQLTSALSALLTEAQWRTQRISDQYDLETKNGTLVMQQAA